MVFEPQTSIVIVVVVGVVHIIELQVAGAGRLYAVHLFLEKTAVVVYFYGVAATIQVVSTAVQPVQEGIWVVHCAVRIRTAVSRVRIIFVVVKYQRCSTVRMLTLLISSAKAAGTASLQEIIVAIYVVFAAV